MNKFLMFLTAFLVSTSALATDCPTSKDDAYAADLLTIINSSKSTCASDNALLDQCNTGTTVQMSQAVYAVVKVCSKKFTASDKAFLASMEKKCEQDIPQGGTIVQNLIAGCSLSATLWIHDNFHVNMAGEEY